MSLNVTDRRAVERIIVELWRQVEEAKPFGKIVATIQLDKLGHVAKSSGVQPAPVTLADLCDLEGGKR